MRGPRNALIGSGGLPVSAAFDHHLVRSGVTVRPGGPIASVMEKVSAGQVSVTAVQL